MKMSMLGQFAKALIKLDFVNVEIQGTDIHGREVRVPKHF